MHTKKGLSDIVTSVLIILLILVAIGIIWAFLRPAINQGAGQLEGIGNVYTTVLTIEPNSATIDTTAQLVTMVVHRNEVAAPLTGMNLILQDASGTTRTTRNATVLSPLESRQITVYYASLGLSGAPTMISVVPVVGLSSSQERLGTPSQAVPIRNAAPTNNPRCGDNLINLQNEVCDGTDRAGKTCMNFTSVTGSPFYFATTLSCAANCLSFVTSACTGWCGDSQANGPELCDDQGFARTCAGYPVVLSARGVGSFYSGTFTQDDCGGDCAIINPSQIDGCYTTGTYCGDMVVQTNEECDAGPNGSPACTATCFTDSTIIRKQCNDHIDNDGDGWVDMGRGVAGMADPGCIDINDNTESTAPAVLTQCNDGLDNDGSGWKDGFDYDCRNPADTNESVL